MRYASNPGSIVDAPAGGNFVATYGANNGTRAEIHRVVIDSRAPIIEAPVVTISTVTVEALTLVSSESDVSTGGILGLSGIVSGNPLGWLTHLSPRAST
jgi:hypothetical protein